MPPKQGKGIMTDATIKAKATPAGSLGAAFEDEIGSARRDVTAEPVRHAARTELK
jgi:hypothetical protein